MQIPTLFRFGPAGKRPVALWQTLGVTALLGAVCAEPIRAALSWAVDAHPIVPFTAILVVVGYQFLADGRVSLGSSRRASDVRSRGEALG